ncbi:patatin-like phospholipase family protein [Xanthomonas campestris pv. campestris]|uniref:patatin-like phospholipase family protein n=1 Tax=Xanthomonas campestris TaxID=339 RepID=UPI00265B9DA8|nr:patatin-like phospholipase family protein [Xanthomonas campestris]MDO0787984.1 patatin-like phospholipase family protein [Xanthomonas campestris pv. campestris]
MDEGGDVREQKVYVAFQGGGAKGVIHAGAFRALDAIFLGTSKKSKVEKFKSKIVGVAGTSAGAIMAALVSCQYKADDLFDPDSNKHILERVLGKKGRSLTRLFTFFGWLRVSFAASITGLLAKYALSLAIFISITMLFLAGLYFNILERSAVAETFMVVSYAAMGVIAIGGWFFAFLLRPGLAPLDRMRDAMDKCIKQSSVGRAAGKDRLTFSQLSEYGGIPLKIVATNLTTKGVQLFSAESTPDVPIADAVCASICLPYIFKPYKISLEPGMESEFVDGGILSNLPLWVFDEERAKEDENWTIGFSIVTPEAKPSRMFGALVEAVVAGPLEIHARGIDNLMVVPLETSLEMLMFGAGRLKFKGEIERVGREASSAIQRNLRKWQAEKALARINESVMKLILSQIELRDVAVDFKPELKFSLACKADKGEGRVRYSSGLKFYDKLERKFEIDESFYFESRGDSDKKNLRLTSSLWLVAASFPEIGETSLEPLSAVKYPNISVPVIVIESPNLTVASLCEILGVDKGPGAVGTALALLMAAAGTAIELMEDPRAEFGVGVFPNVDDEKDESSEQVHG